MTKAFSKILIIIIGVVVVGGGIFVWQKWQALLNSSISGTGTVKFINLEGGFYGIESDDGKKYDPVNLASEFRQDGLRVKFNLGENKDVANVHMWGMIVQIDGIEKLLDETVGWQTYKNEQYGFEFNYPPEYIIKTIQEREQGGFNCFRLFEGDRINSKFQVTIDCGGRGLEPESTVVFIDNIKANRYVFNYPDGTKDILIVLFKEDDIYYNIISAPSVSADEEKIFNTILSTFRFTE